MKKALLLLFYCLLFTVHSSSAQKIRFTDTSNRWYVFWAYWSGSSTSEYSYKGDTIVNGYKYQILNSAFIREDTVLHKVYFKDMSGWYTQDTNENVLYDYTLNKGDTLNYNSTTSSYKLKFVAKIDSVLIDSTYHKTWQIGGIPISPYTTTDSFLYSYIEGIGCTTTPLFPINPAKGSGATLYITCFRNNVGKPTINPYVKAGLLGNFQFNNLGQCVVSINKQSTQPQAITIYPNPANENSVIKLPYKLQSGMLVIINTVGQVVSQKEIQNKEQVILGTLPVQGLYIYRVTDKQSNQSFTGKFVYE